MTIPKGHFYFEDWVALGIPKGAREKIVDISTLYSVDKRLALIISPFSANPIPTTAAPTILSCTEGETKAD